MNWQVKKDIINGDEVYSITHEGSVNRIACRIPSKGLAELMAKAPEMAEELRTLKPDIFMRNAEIARLEAQIERLKQLVDQLNDIFRY